jgi:hypothetical protein
MNSSNGCEVDMDLGNMVIQMINASSKTLEDSLKTLEHQQEVQDTK